LLVKLSKQLKDTDLGKEYLDIQKNCIFHSFKKEHNQNNYIKKLNVLNKRTGELSSVGDYGSQIMKRVHNYHQKSSTILKVSVDRGLIPIFITLTLPKQHHPFRTVKTKNTPVFVKNNSFGFESITQSIKKGYKLLSSIHRKMYKQLKKLNKDMFYINCLEYHKSFIPHLSDELLK
jgi:hypothetical protein